MSKRNESGQFRKGQSGNPKGRPKGSKKRYSAREIADDLFIQVVVGCAEQGVGLSPDQVLELKKTALTDARDHIRDCNALEGHYRDSGAAYFKYLGLPANCTLQQFFEKYTTEQGSPDIEAAADDLGNYPPVKARVAELREQACSPDAAMGLKQELGQ